MKSHAAYLGTALLLTGLTICAIAHATNTYADGWIGHVNGRQLDICYRVTSLPAVGARLQVMRLAYVIPGKGVPIEHFAASGQATVTSITDAHCVRAELVQGTAQWADHTRPMP